MREANPPALRDAASDHRHRLIGAMVEVASEHGYAGATVSRVVERAGVSRHAFYEQFVSRNKCFLAAYRRELGAVEGAVRAAAAASPVEERPEAILDALLLALDANPAGARLILIEALGASREIRREHEELIERLDAEIGQFLEAQPSGRAIQIPAAALLGGVEEVLATHTLSGLDKPISDLRGELVRWMDAYRLPEGQQPLPQSHWRELGRRTRVTPAVRVRAPDLLPRGRTALAAEDASRIRKRRILEATLGIVATNGYAELTVARIVAAARISRTAFYSHFESKDDALEAAQTEGMQGAMGVAAAEYSLHAPWPKRVWRSAAALLTYVADHHELARLDFVEAYVAGREATQRRQQNRTVFILFLEEGYRQNAGAAEMTRFCSEAIAAAMFGLMRKMVLVGRTEAMLSLLPAAAYTILAPFLGPSEAASEVKAWAGAAR